MVTTACSSDGTDPEAAIEDDTDPEPAIQLALDAAVEALEIEGASVAVITGDNAWHASSGIADRLDAPVRPETRFALASITKTFTSVVALRLSERGVVDLDEAIELSGLAPDTTMRDLLGHTAGLAYPARLDGASWDAAAFASAAGQPRACDVRECFAYSDLGFVAAGLALQEAAGEPFVDLLRAEVLDPIGLASTALIERPAQAVDVAFLDRHDDPASVPPDAAIPVNTWSAGAMVATADDLARFGSALFDGELIEPSSLNAMQDMDRSGSLPCVDGCLGPYGLGLRRTRPGGHVAWGHDGSSGAVLAHFPDEDVTIAVLTTRRDSGASLLHAVMNAVPGLEDRGDIHTIDLESGEINALVTEPALDGGPSWSPDGERIAFGSTRDGNPELYVADVDGGNVRRLTDHDADDLAARWSPDGRTIVFASDRAGNLDLWLVDAEGGDPRQLTDDPVDEELPAFSPDGRHIAFSTSPDDGDTAIVVIDVDGTGRRTIDAPGEDWIPSWSPDGRSIAFQRRFAGIWTMAADGSDQRQLSPPETSDGWPSWGPTGRIAFVHDGDLWTMADDGSDRQPVTYTPDAEEYLAAWSPDGRSLVFTTDAAP